MVSGELGLAGYRFQYHVMVLAALELWGGRPDSDVDSIVVEGRPGAQVVDYELTGKGPYGSALVQVKGRWGERPWGAPELFRILTELAGTEDRPIRLELVANGAFSEPARQLAALLADASGLDDQALTRRLASLGLVTGDVPSELLASLRHAVITIRSEGLPELREAVRTRLRKLRAAHGSGVGDQAAELLRAYLLERAMNKSEAADVAGRTLRKNEFLEAVRAPRSVLESALESRWGIPVGLAHRDTAVQREALLAELAKHLKDKDGLPAADGRVRTCVLVGPAGIGKTTLAQQYALHNAGEFDWIYQITAQADDDATPGEHDVLKEELERFAVWLAGHSVSVRPGPYRSLTDGGRAIAEALASCPRTWLLIVDNATTADTLTSLLPAAGHGAIVITSRNSAWHGSQPVVEVGELTLDQGRELVRRRLDGMDVDPNHVETLCAEMGCFPLSLVTATSYLRSTREPLGRFLTGLADEDTRLAAMDFPQRLEDYPRNAVAAISLAVRRLSALEHEGAKQAISVLHRAALVFPDRIPVELLADHQRGFARSVALLGKFSLVQRWQDDQQRDWVRVHRLIQDVVRADLDQEPEHRDALLQDVEIRVTDLLKGCTDRFDLVTGGALRLHAITLAERLGRHGLQRWQSTTALLANTASVAHAQGDFVEEQLCLEQALSLLPPDSYDPHVAGRRGKTLTSLAMFHLDRNETDAGLAALEEARRVHDAHRFIPAHFEALIVVMAMQYQTRAYRAEDDREMKRLFDLAKALPEPSLEAATMRAACLLRIARFMDARAGHRSAFADAAERLFALVQHDEEAKPLQTAVAHLGLAEAHGSDGNTEAAWRHYRRAMQLISGIPGIDPARASDEALELVAGLLSVHLDQNTQLPHSDIDELLSRTIADVERGLGEVDWTATQQGWLRAQFHALKGRFFANRGDVTHYVEQMADMHTAAKSSSVVLPRNVATQVALLPGLRRHARTQQVRMSAPAVGVYGQRNTPPPDRPDRAPAPCRHFDPDPARNRWSPSPEPTPPKPVPPGVRVDRQRSIACHAALLRTLAENDSADPETALRAACAEPATAIDHLIGAWRILETMSAQLSTITGETTEAVRDFLDTELARAHLERGTDTVPTRLVLRAMNNGWHAELNQLLRQFDQDSMAEMLSALVRVEDIVVQRLCSYTGNRKSELVRSVTDEAASLERAIPDPETPTYSAVTGTVVVDRDLLGEPRAVRLHDPGGAGVDHIFVLGGAQEGKSGMLHRVILQAAVSGSFAVSVADPRNEHASDEIWKSLSGTVKLVGTHVAGTLATLEAASRIVEARADAGGFERLAPARPGVLFAVDDIDEVIRLPRGRTLVERVLAAGPAVCVGLATVIRELESVRDNETVLRSIVDCPNVICLGPDTSEAVEQLRADYLRGSEHG
jgi:tetratricopeptide (TPR) repeat protein